MLKYSGKVKGRFKGTYTDRNGEVRTKIVYNVVDDDYAVNSITDYNCTSDPFCIDENIEVPVKISAYLRDGKAMYGLSLLSANNQMGNLEAF